MRIGSFVFNFGMKSYYMEDWRTAVKDSRMLGKKVYCWKSVGVENWLEKGLSITDVLCLVLLPKGLPRYIDLPDDEFENE